MPLPSIGHIGKDRSVRVGEPIGRLPFIEKGRHLILGQREGRGSTDSLLLLGKVIEHTKTQDRYDANVWLDVSFPHVIFLCGTRGSGKSFDIGVLIEGLMLKSDSQVATAQKPVSTVIFDLQNQFWTLSKTPDENLSEDEEHVRLLRQWNLQPQSLKDVRLLAPSSDPKLIGTEEDLAISTADLTADDLCSLWQTDAYSAQGHLLTQVLDKVKVTLIRFGGQVNYAV